MRKSVFIRELRFAPCNWAELHGTLENFWRKFVFSDANGIACYSFRERFEFIDMNTFPRVWPSGVGDFHNVERKSGIRPFVYLILNGAILIGEMFIDFNIEPFAIFLVIIALVPKILWRIYPLLSNDTFQQTRNSRSSVLCVPCYNALLGNTTIFDKKSQCFLWGPTRSYIRRVCL
jgi:hypothetical protein